jgi:ABC-2 type transport system permease protein
VSSAAAGAPAIAAPTRPRTRHPSTLTVYRWELRKLVSLWRTYIGIALVVLLPLVFVLVESLRHHHDNGEGIFQAQITQSGLATPVLMLTFLSNFMLPLAASLVAGDIVANEDGHGTLKTILTRSVDRGQVIAAKALAAFTYAVVVVFVSAIVATAAGIIAWGFHSVVSFSGTVVSAGEALELVFASNALYLIPFAAVVSIGVLLSTVMRNSAAAVVGTLGVVIMLFILSAIPGFEGAKPYLLTQQFEAWQGLLRTPTDWAPITHSIWVCALYAVPSLVIAYLVFLRRDVAGG